VISSVSGPHFLPLELNFAHLFLLFSVSPENLDPVDFGAGGRGEAFKSAAPGLTGERSVWDESQKSVRFESRRLLAAPAAGQAAYKSVFCPWGLQNAVLGPPWASRVAPRRSRDALWSLWDSSDVMLMPSETSFGPFWSQNGHKTETKSSLKYYRPADRVQSLNS